MPDDARQQHFLEAEQQVELRSAELKKELRLRDLVFSQMAYIVGLQWMGTAAKLGSAHIMYWIPAVLLFYVPSGIVVVHLSREIPLEGGLYQWAKLRFGDLAGFLVALNLCATLILIIGSGISQLTDNLAYASSRSSMVESKAVTLTVAAVLLVSLMFVAVRGMHTSKWLHNLGGFVIVVALVMIVAFALPRWMHGTSAATPIALSFPAVSLLNLNILGKMGFGAFSGFDGVTIFTGEVRDPNAARVIKRSVWLSAPMIAAFYIVGTVCVLTFSRPSEIDLISPTTQVVTRGALGTPFALFAGPVLAILLICNLVGSESIYFNALIRLPMVAGWDRLLPAWLSRLHPRYRTPVGSILCLGIITLVLTTLGNLGVGAQESFQLLNNAGLICWGLTYLVMFAIPLVASTEKPQPAVRVAAIAGFSMTLLYVTLSIYPIIDVQSPAAFAAKVGGVVGGINLLGVWYFRRANKRRASELISI